MIGKKVFWCSGRDSNPGLRLERPKYLTGLYYRSLSQSINHINHTYVLTFLHQKDIFAEEGVPPITFAAATLTLSTYLSSV